MNSASFVCHVMCTAKLLVSTGIRIHQDMMVALVREKITGSLLSLSRLISIFGEIEKQTESFNFSGQNCLRSV